MVWPELHGPDERRQHESRCKCRGERACDAGHDRRDGSPAKQCESAQHAGDATQRGNDPYCQLVPCRRNTRPDPPVQLGRAVHEHEHHRVRRHAQVGRHPAQRQRERDVEHDEHEQGAHGAHEVTVREAALRADLEHSKGRSDRERPCLTRHEQRLEQQKSASASHDDERDEQRAVDASGQHVRRDRGRWHDHELPRKPPLQPAPGTAAKSRPIRLAQAFQQPDEHRERNEEHERRRNRFGVVRLRRRDTNRDRRSHHRQCIGQPQHPDPERGGRTGRHSRRCGEQERTEHPDQADARERTHYAGTFREPDEVASFVACVAGSWQEDGLADRQHG